MRKGVDHRAITKTGVTKRASREGKGEPTEPTDGGQDKRPRGAARLGDGRGIVLASVFIVAPRCEPGLHSLRRLQFRNPFNENSTSRDIRS
jgi:hypothetical protein